MKVEKDSLEIEYVCNIKRMIREFLNKNMEGSEQKNGQIFRKCVIWSDKAVDSRLPKGDKQLTFSLRSKEEVWADSSKQGRVIEDNVCTQQMGLVMWDLTDSASILFPKCQVRRHLSLWDQEVWMVAFSEVDGLIGRYHSTPDMR